MPRHSIFLFSRAIGLKTIYLRLSFAAVIMVFAPHTAIAKENCGRLDSYIQYPDGTRSCITRETPFFNLIGPIPNRKIYDALRSHQTFSVAVTRDQKSCPLVTGVSWDWSVTQSPQKALELCNKKFSPEYVSCTCEIIYDNGKTPLARTAFNEKALLLEQHWLARTEPLGERVKVALPNPPIAERPAAPATASTPQRARESLFSVTAGLPDADGIVTLDFDIRTNLSSLRINGVEQVKPGANRQQVARFVQLGENLLEIIAINTGGEVERKQLTVFRDHKSAVTKVEGLDPSKIRQAPIANTVAIVIGVEKYARVQKADYANRDARLFYDYARRAFGITPENIRLLVDEEANAAEILLTFRKWLPSRVQPKQSELLVFFSGHGLMADDGKNQYLLPTDVSEALLDRTAISKAEIVEAIKRANPSTVTLFFDSCYSGATRTGESILANARPIKITPKNTYVYPENFTVFSASAGDQISSGSPNLQHGIFSFHLMKGLEGLADADRDKTVTAAELHSYVAVQVSKDAGQLNRIQDPQIIGDRSRTMVRY